MAATERVRGLRPADPRELGSYAILGRLGEGGMGSVFLARAADGRKVALKVIRAELADNAEFRNRFRQEVARAQEVPPFCTAEVLDADTEHDPPYLVVEYVDGPSLSEVVAEHGPLTPANQHGIALGVAVALTAIHGAGVIHRDLKPGNVLLAPGSPKVIDFGIARAAAGSQLDTRTDEVVGTVAYMAPERFGPDATRALTPAADVFAWGAIVAFAATGRTPFAADLPAAVAARIMTQPPDLNGLSGSLRDLVERALAKDPADRPTARELVDSLLSGGDRVAARPAAFAEQPEVLAAAGIAATGVGQTVTVPGAVPPGPRMAGPFAPGPPPGQPGPTAAPMPSAGSTVYLPMPQARRGGGIRVAVVALTVAVLLLAGAVVAIWTGKLGGASVGGGVPSASGVHSQASIQPTTTEPTSPAPSASPTAGPSITTTTSRAPSVFTSVAPGAVSLVAGSFGNWESNDDLANQATCEAGPTQLAVTLSSATTRSYRCKGPQFSLTDFTITVDVTLANANSCAGVWFHYNNSGGYALMICPNRYELITHVSTTATRVLTLFTDERTDSGEVIHAGIRAEGNRVWFFRDDKVSAEITADQFASGRLVLGVFPGGSGPAFPPPYEATFTNVNIWQAPSA